MSTSPEEFERLHRVAESRLARNLDPMTPREMRVVAWLQGWERETLDILSDMIERRW